MRKRGSICRALLMRDDATPLCHADVTPATLMPAIPPRHARHAIAAPMFSFH